MQTQRSRGRTHRRARRSTTYYVAPARKRGSHFGHGSRVGHKRLSTRHKWTRLLFLATLATGPLASTAHSAFALGLSKQLPAKQLFPAFDSHSISL
jgi:hypothetical protein